MGLDNATNMNAASTPAANNTTITSAQLLKRIDAIQELPTLSTVAMQVSSMLQDINTSAQDLAKVIENDQAIVPKLLKLVNSAFFGFSQKVTSVSHALMLLGFNTVRNAVLAIEVINAFKMKNKIEGFDITLFWKHAISVAVVSRYLDQATGGSHREDVFTAGLIHDIGKIVMARYFPDNFESTWRHMQAHKLTFLDAEQKHFPVRHAAIGAQLAKKWNLPDILRQVIAKHHTTRKKPSGDDLVLMVHAADALVHNNIQDGEVTEGYPICMAARQLFGPQLDKIDEWMPVLREEIESACRSLMED